MTKGICCKCQTIYEGRRIDQAIRCGEVLECEKCGGILLGEEREDDASTN